MEMQRKWNNFMKSMHSACNSSHEVLSFDAKHAVFCVRIHCNMKQITR